MKQETVHPRSAERQYWADAVKNVWKPEIPQDADEAKDYLRRLRVAVSQALLGKLREVPYMLESTFTNNIYSAPLPGEAHGLWAQLKYSNKEAAFKSFSIEKITLEDALREAHDIKPSQSVTYDEEQRIVKPGEDQPVTPTMISLFYVKEQEHVMKVTIRQNYPIKGFSF